MSLFGGMNTSASALTANRLRLDTISANLANSQTTRAKMVNGVWEPYRRKMVEMAPKSNEPFSDMLDAAIGTVTGRPEQGVRVTAIKEDNSEFQRVYNPEHPDSDREGYVRMPNVDTMREMIDLISASRAYDANVTAFNAMKSMMMKAFEISGK